MAKKRKYSLRERAILLLGGAIKRRRKAAISARWSNEFGAVLSGICGDCRLTSHVLDFSARICPSCFAERYGKSHAPENKVFSVPENKISGAETKSYLDDAGWRRHMDLLAARACNAHKDKPGQT